MTSRVWGVRTRPKYDLAKGRCVGHREPEIWFDPAREWEARRICHECPVRALCMLAALEFGEEWGVWGGTAPYERGTSPALSA